MKSKVGKPLGSRKRPITTTDIARIEQMAAVGLTNDQMACLLGVSPSTFDRRIKDTALVKSAVEKGRAQAVFNVGVSAYQQAISGRIPAMTMFYLKCRAGWKETVVNEHTGKDGEKLFTTFTDMVKKVKNGK